MKGWIGRQATFVHIQAKVGRMTGFKTWQSDTEHHTSRSQMLLIIFFFCVDPDKTVSWNVNNRSTRCTPSASIKVSATGRLLDITYMCYDYTTPSSLANSDNPDKMTCSVTFHLLSVNRWRHNEYSCCSHSSCSYRSNAHMWSKSD